MATPACAHRAAKIDAPLGRVVIYRNGVAYFERRATVEGSFSLEVPRDRVDDFLKSLTVVDLQSKTPLAVSYRTPRETRGASVKMTIELPRGAREVLITYVTESPAWKPSYRVMLKDEDSAVLQSLAVVDNISNEPWEKVRVGVGSTSALSFRYDLHSVRMVERQTLDDGNAIAMAPPKGGSAYATGGRERRLLAEVSADSVRESISMEEFRNIPTGTSSGRDFTQMVESSATASNSAGIAIAGTTRAESKYTVDGSNVSQPSYGTVGGAEPEDAPEPPADPLVLLANQLQIESGRVRIEGYRLSSEPDDAQVGLRRANTVREQLIAYGVEPSRIEVAEGRGPVDDPSTAVQIVAADDGPAMTQAAPDGGGDEPRGSALFNTKDPVSLDVGHSAMITLLEVPTSARRVYLFDPASERGSTRFAFNAVRIANPTEHTLDSGPVTVYAEGQYLGEGLADPIPPHTHALVPYALDRMLRVRSESDTHDEIQRLLTARRGVVTTETERVRTSTTLVHNRGTKTAVVYVRHTVPSGWTLRAPPTGTERYGDDVLVPVRVEAGKRARLALTEAMPIETALDLRSAEGAITVKRFIESGRAPPALAQQLQRLVSAHDASRTIVEKLVTEEEHVDALRTRVNELRAQLTLLRKVKEAKSLSSQLAERMRAVGNDLDAALLRVSTLHNDHLEARIQLSTLLADLALDSQSSKLATRE